MTGSLRPFLRVPGIIYGPVSSRRLGTSLGINVFPGTRKACSFECPYCQLGHADDEFERAMEKQKLPIPEEIAEALEAALEVLGPATDGLNALTFSGNGEPTAHPKFLQIVRETKRIRDRLVRRARIAVLTNGAHLDRREVIEALNLLDDPIVKLDTGTEETFQSVNFPRKGLRLEKIVRGIRKLRRVLIQSMFVQGNIDNTSESEIEAWVTYLKEIQPAGIQIYTLDRIPADESVLPVPAARLAEIARRVQEATGIEPLLTLPST